MTPWSSKELSQEQRSDMERAKRSDTAKSKYLNSLERQLELLLVSGMVSPQEISVLLSRTLEIIGQGKTQTNIGDFR